MANLLLNVDSFSWRNLKIDRSHEMEDLGLAVGTAIDNDDEIIGHPDAFVDNLGWGSIDDLITCTEEELQFFTNGWFTGDFKTTLLKLRRTHKGLRNLEELEDACQGQNNGWIGCYFREKPDKMVYDEDSWESLHASFVSQNPSLRKTNPNYFYKHYVPSLTIPESQINQLIKQKRVHRCFVRLDTPSLSPTGEVLHGEKIGIHFGNEVNKACLYIDGTWKHGNGTIPSEAKQQLLEWGFVLPIDQR